MHKDRRLQRDDADRFVHRGGRFLRLPQPAQVLNNSPKCGRSRPQIANNSGNYSFIDRFICRIFPAESKALLLHFYLGAIHTATPRDKQRTSNALSLSMHQDNTSTHRNNIESKQISVAQQTLFNPYNEHCVLAAATTSGAITVKPRFFKGPL